MKSNFLSVRITFIICFVVLLSGCAEHRGSSVAYVSQISPGHYETKLLSVEMVAGGPCNFPQWPHREYMSYWIYTDTTNGVVPAERLTVAYGHYGDSFRPTQEGPLHGSVSFLDGRMSVQLQFPWFSDSGHIDRYQSFDLNGTYEIQAK
jgi:hypothetical protein